MSSMSPSEQRRAALQRIGDAVACTASCPSVKVYAAAVLHTCSDAHSGAVAVSQCSIVRCVMVRRGLQMLAAFACV